MDDKADPLDGWPIRDVIQVRTTAPEDLYGKLYQYLRSVFQWFLDRLAKVKVDFELFNMNAVELPQILLANKYARIEVSESADEEEPSTSTNRIEVSNITDAGYLGTRETLRFLSPLLQPPHENPHAVVISAYLNAVMEMVNLSGDMDGVLNMDLLLRYLPDTDLFSMLRRESPQILKLWDARTIVLDRAKFFGRS